MKWLLCAALAGGLGGTLILYRVMSRPAPAPNSDSSYSADSSCSDSSYSADSCSDSSDSADSASSSSDGGWKPEPEPEIMAVLPTTSRLYRLFSRRT